MLHPVLLQVAALATAAATGAPPWRAVVVAGGPTPDMNQVAIEKNVRYFDRILPPVVDRRVLFADGKRETPTVQFLQRRSMRYRAPELPRLDGPTTQPGVAAVWRGFVTARPDDPLLLYFTGHGSRNRRNLDDNVFDLWGGGGLGVRQLAARIDELPITTPVVVVMAQCYSGAFANLLFEDGDPSGAVTERDLAGFFAATRELPASGCTPEVNEADYRDFTSFFFAALSGRDRLGGAVRSADYDGNGRVGMNEAYAYALVHQESTDVPVATSDAFVRRFVHQADAETMATPYATVLRWSSPAQRAALEGLSAALRLRGEDRLRTTFDDHFGFRNSVPVDEATSAYRLRFIRLAKTVVLAHELREHGDRRTVARFDRLLASEARNPLAEASPPRDPLGYR
jgi:hypothetical protein